VNVSVNGDALAGVVRVSRKQTAPSASLYENGPEAAKSGGIMNSSLTPWKVLSGSLTLGHETEGWSLADHAPWGEDSVRTFTLPVSFASGFADVPVVQMALTGFDIDQRHTARISTRATNITAEGFLAEITTWADTRVYAVELGWLAIGP
jgi:hypothetical protein